MANLQRIQECIDQISDLLHEVDNLKPVPQATIGGIPFNPLYSSEEVHCMERRISSWKATTYDVIAQEIGGSHPCLSIFLSHWRRTQEDYNVQTRMRRKLQQAREDLEEILLVAKDPGRRQKRDDDIWSLIHPSIAHITRPRMVNGFFADAVESACKQLNARVRDIVKEKKGEELDGAKLMNKAFSVENPIIRIAKGNSASARDTQLGYMQIFSGVMTGIRNPKAHDNENITKEDALRKLIMISILLYKVDERVK